MHCFSAQQGAKQSSHERGAASAARLVKREIRHTGNRALHHQDFTRARRCGRRRHDGSSSRGGYEHVGHLVYYNDAPNDLYPETYTFGEGTPDWMYRVPPFRMLDPGDHMMDRYVKHAKTWAEAAKAGVADVE